MRHQKISILYREAAETLLFLTGMERDEAAADTTAAVAPEPPVAPAAEGTPATAAEPGGVSPLQALVQDIMQQQKQRAQVKRCSRLSYPWHVLLETPVQMALECQFGEVCLFSWVSLL